MLSQASDKSPEMRGHINRRSNERITEELAKVVTQLSNMQGPSNIHRVTAYSQVSSSTCRDIEKAVFSNARMNHLTQVETSKRLQDESTVRETRLHTELARQQQHINALVAQQKSSEVLIMQLQRHADVFKHEWEKALLNAAACNQCIVELRLKGLDFKCEVDKRSSKVLKSVHARLGFVPTAVHKQVSYLQALKSPGDENYAAARALTPYMHTVAKTQSRGKDKGKTRDKEKEKDSTHVHVHVPARRRKSSNPNPIPIPGYSTHSTQWSRIVHEGDLEIDIDKNDTADGDDDDDDYNPDDAYCTDSYINNYQEPVMRTVNSTCTSSSSISSSIDNASSDDDASSV